MAGYKHLEIVQDFEKYVKDKKMSSKAYYRYFLSRVTKMFQYKNLPDTIPHEILDRYLFENGIACITKYKDNLYVFSGSAGSFQDIYYRPTAFIISNPALDMNSKEIQIFDKLGQPTTIETPDSGVLIRNDSEWIGLHPLIARYSYLLAENVLTLRTADVLLRIIALLSAKTDAERVSAKEYLASIEKGELGVVGESAFYEGIEMQSPPSNNGSYLTQFIEYQQYLKGSFYNEIGLSANYNMKREAIGTGESTLDQDTILPLCENMLLTRREDLNRVNQMYGTSIEVEFSSAWLENRLEEISTLQTMSNPTPFGQPTMFGQSPTSLTSSTSSPSDTLVNQSDNDGEPKLGEVGSTDNSDEDVKESGQDGGNTGAYGTSEINDISQDEVLTEILDDLVNQQPMEPVVEVGEQEGDDNNETTDDKEDIPNN